MRQSDLSFIIWGLYVPFSIPPKHVPRKHFQKRSTEGIPVPMYAELQLKWCMHLNIVGQRDRTRMNPSLSTEILLFFGGVAMVGWALSLYAH